MSGEVGRETRLTVSHENISSRLREGCGLTDSGKSRSDDGAGRPPGPWDVRISPPFEDKKGFWTGVDRGFSDDSTGVNGTPNTRGEIWGQRGSNVSPIYAQPPEPLNRTNII